MADVLRNIGGVPVLACGETGIPLGAGSGANVVLGEASTQGARAIAVPLARLGDGFFDPESGVADSVLRTFAAYRLPLAIIGDRPENADEQFAFVPDIDALTALVESKPA